MALIGAMERFNIKHDDWNMYQEQLEQFFAVNNIVDTEGGRKRVAALLSLIGTETYKILRDLCTPHVPSTKTYEELCALLQGHFSPATCPFRERIEYYEAKQDEAESINAWNARIRNLATNCEFGANLEAVLKDKFISGMRKSKIRDRLCEEKTTVELKTLIEIALTKEATMQAERKADVNIVDRRTKGHHQRQHKSNERSEWKNGAAVSTSGGWECRCCGGRHTGSQQCKYSNYRCNECKKVGHLAKVCGRRPRQNNMVQVEENEEDAQIYNIDFSGGSSIRTKVAINNIELELLLDSGAATTVVTDQLYSKQFKHCSLNRSNLVLRDYSGNRIETLGYMKVEVEYKKVKVKNFVVHVVKNGTQNLLGRDFMGAFKFRLVSDICNISREVQDIHHEFKQLFEPGLGEYKHKTFSVTVQENAQPIFMKPRPVPFAYKAKIEQELDRLQRQGVITPIETSDWGTPLVPVPKGDGAIRLCGDYKTTVNKSIINARYPLPRVEEIFNKLNGGESFTKIDLSDAYNQLCIDEESGKRLAWSTHKGLFRLNRLPFGITPASAIFQKTIEQTLQQLEGVASFVDDIIVTGRDRKEHERNLRATFAKLQDAGFRIRPSKCAFYQKEINYLGHTISKDGLRKNQDKIEAILNAPRPTSPTQVKSFAGLVNYYSKFIPNISSVMRPIYGILKKNSKFEWSESCERAFEEIKRLIASEQVLTHFNPELDILLATDASKDGIAAALSHRMPNGEIRPVLFISRTLTPAEGNYAVLDKEALAIYWSVRKLHQYLIGQKFTIQTDHKPLVTLYGESNPIPPMTSSRIHRWALYLSGFTYKIQYVKGTENNVADMLSRHALSINKIELDEEDESQLHLIISEGIPITSEIIGTETEKDTILRKVLGCVKNGWSEMTELEMKPYYLKRNEISCEGNCLTWGCRVIIPETLRHHLLDELHASHMGIVKMKSIARSYFWWPKLDEAIERIAKSCRPCLKVAPDPKKINIPWFRPGGPNERIHIDFLGPIEGNQYLIIQDAYSKWPEVFKMKTTTTEATTTRLREYFTRWGIPETVVSDNGPQLVSGDFESFLRRNGVRHVTIPPYHPESNGLAENAVKTFKKGFKAALLDARNSKTSKDVLVCRYLLSYRSSRHCTTNKTPAFLMLGRELKTVFDLLRPDTNQKADAERTDDRDKPDIRRINAFAMGDVVMIRDYRTPNKKKWIEGEIVQAIGGNSYMCETEDGQRWKRHEDQLRKVGDGTGGEGDRQPAKGGDMSDKREHTEQLKRFGRKVLGRSASQGQAALPMEVRSSTSAPERDEETSIEKRNGSQRQAASPMEAHGSTRAPERDEEASIEKRTTEQDGREEMHLSSKEDESILSPTTIDQAQNPTKETVKTGIKAKRGTESKANEIESVRPKRTVKKPKRLFEYATWD